MCDEMRPPIDLPPMKSGSPGSFFFASSDDLPPVCFEHRCPIRRLAPGGDVGEVEGGGGYATIGERLRRLDHPRARLPRPRAVCEHKGCFRPVGSVELKYRHEFDSRGIA